MEFESHRRFLVLMWTLGFLLWIYGEFNFIRKEIAFIKSAALIHFNGTRDKDGTCPACLKLKLGEHHE